MSPAGDSVTTGQTVSRDRSNRSSIDRPPELTSQTGGSDRSDRSNAEWLQQRIEHYRARTKDMCETINESEDMDKLGQGFTPADPLEKVDLGDGTIPRPTFVNKNLSVEFKGDLIKLLKEYIDCFAWEHSEMPGLSRDLVEHRLPIKAGFKPYKQPARHFNPSIYDRIKEEINRLLDASFIRSCHYADWISNIVLLKRKIRARFVFALILEIPIKLLQKMSILCL